MVTSRCALVMGGLFLFGLGYNVFVAWLEQGGRDRGYTGILVIVGTLATLGGYAVLVEFDSVLLAAFCFAASGTPMAVGSMWRHIQRREREERETRDLAKALATEYLSAGDE